MQDNIENAAQSAPQKDLGKLLSAEHAQLEKIFEAMLCAFEADARDDAMRFWNQFDSKLQAHFALEEARVLPALKEVNAPEAEALLREHAQLREKLLRLGIGVDLHVTRDTQVQEFVRELKAHAKREDALMYRFCSEKLAH